MAAVSKRVRIVADNCVCVTGILKAPEKKVAVPGLQKNVLDRTREEAVVYIKKLGNKEKELAEVTQENAKRLDSLQYKVAKTVTAAKRGHNYCKR